jgi:hypothetical protein
MTEPTYITLKQASEHLQAKGLIGQTSRVLRNAIARGTLAAARDGRSWATTVAKLDEYEKALWMTPSIGGVGSRSVVHTPRRTPPRKPSSERQADEASSRRLLALLAPAPRKSGERRPRRPRRPKPTARPEPQPKSEAELEYEALPPEERKQRFRDYLDGNRPDWH